MRECSVIFDPGVVVTELYRIVALGKQVLTVFIILIAHNPVIIIIIVIVIIRNSIGKSQSDTTLMSKTLKP